MATRDDVARLAGVSPSTVSYVISGERSITPSTRDRVREAMRQLQYTPNAYARGLAGARSNIIALHYPYSPHGLSVTELEYVAAVADASRRRGYHLLLWSNPMDDLDGLRRQIKEGIAGAVLLMEVVASDQRIALLRASDVPFAAIGRPDNSVGVSYVDDDFDSLVEQALDHLSELGHRRVGFVYQVDEGYGRGAGPLTRIRTALDTYARRHELEPVAVPAAPTGEGGREALDTLMSRSPRPTGLIIFAEEAITGLVRAAITGGTRIPEDLAIVALSISDVVAEASNPPLTTVSPPVPVLAELAVDFLVDVVEGREKGARQRLVSPVLTVRGSSMPRP